jgi:Multisubunit Na+/H+ antiporter, MnhB subunit
MKRFFTIFFLVVITVLSFYVSGLISSMPATYDGVAKYMVDYTILRTHALNTVTAITFDFRGYDTLGESFVLCTAVTGVAVILRKSVGGGKKDEKK